MIHSGKIAEIFKHRNIFREEYGNWVGYEYTANTLITLESISTSHCVREWRSKKAEYLPWSSRDSDMCLMIIVTSISRTRVPAQTVECLICVHVCIWQLKKSLWRKEHQSRVLMLWKVQWGLGVGKDGGR